MLNTIWLGMILISILFGAMNGHLQAVVNSVTTSAQFAITLSISLAGIMIFWLGILRIAENANLIQLLAKLVHPIMRRLFPDIPENHPAIGAMLCNMSANMLGVSNAATPFGLKAMKELQKLNEDKTSATDEMCLFLAINTSSIQLIPTSAIALLAAGGASDPTSIIFPTLIATSCSTIVAIVLAKSFAKNKRSVAHVN